MRMPKEQQPNKLRRDISHREAMKISSQAELKAILSSGRIYGPVSNMDELRSMAPQANLFSYAK